MSGNVEKLLVDECEEYMTSAFHKGICLDGSGSNLNGVLADFESALQMMPDCAPILGCCAMLKFMLEKKAEAREYLMRASRNEHCFKTQTIAEVCKFVWVEFMKWTIYGQPLIGKQIEVKYQKTLPPLPPQFQSASCKDQVFKGVFHFSLSIERIADTVELTLTLKHAEIGVSNVMENDNFQGYFLHAYDIDVSPSLDWAAKSQFLTVRSVGRGQTSQPIQQQQSAGYNAQFGIGGSTTPIPNLNFSYTSSQAISSHQFSEEMSTRRGIEGNDKAMRMTWKVNTYEKGKPFVVEAVRKIRRLPYSPSHHVCNDPLTFEGKWVVPLNIAGGLQYDFPWRIHLRAHFALLPKKSRMPFMSAPEPETYEYAPLAEMAMSDFYSTSMQRMFIF